MSDCNVEGVIQEVLAVAVLKRLQPLMTDELWNKYYAAHCCATETSLEVI